MGWGGTHRSWPGGRGVDQGQGGGGVGAGWQFQRRGRVGAWLAVPKRGKSREGLKSRCVIFRSWRVDLTGLPGQGRVGLAGQELGGGPRASVPEGVGGRGTGPRDGANFATCVVFLSFLTRTKRRKIAFFEGCPVEWGGVPTGAGLVDQGPWWQERVGKGWLGGARARGGSKGFGCGGGRW